MALDVVNGKCVLKIGGTRLLLSIDTAMKFINMLFGEEFLYFVEENYVKDPNTGNYGHIKVFETVDSDRLSINFMSNSEFLMREANMKENG